MLYYNKSINQKIKKSKIHKSKNPEIKINEYGEKVFKDIAKI